jgi:hypothetical protein
MNSEPRTRTAATLLALIAVGAGGGVAAAAPGGVAYIDGGHVQLANLDGSKKIQLSSGDAWWNAAAQSDTGGVLATKNEPGKIAQLSMFQTWDAAGNPARFGPLNHDASGASLAMPLTLEMTASNGVMLYGYSSLTFGFPVGTLSQGYYLQATATASVGTPLKQTALMWPTLAGDRVIGTPNRTSISVLNADQNLIGDQTTPWLDLSAIPGAEVHETSPSADGTVLAASVHFSGSGEQKVAMLRTAGLGLALLTGDCWLPASGNATQPSVSTDGTVIAWKDDGGLKIAGVPDFSGADPCTLTKPPVMISPTGTSPALGPIDVDAIWAARNPAPPATTAPTTAPTMTPSTVTFSATAPPKVTARAVTGKTGIAVTVVTPAAGAVTVTVTIAPKLVGRTGTARIVIAKGTATARVAGKVVVRVRPTAIGRKLTAKLRGKRVTLIARVGTRTTSRLVRLR